jgi:hypothetical protein
MPEAAVTDNVEAEITLLELMEPLEVNVTPRPRLVIVPNAKLPVQ